MEPGSRPKPSRPGLDGGLLTLAILSVSFGAILARWTDASALVVAFWRTFGGGLLLVPSATMQRRDPTRRTVGPTELTWLMAGGTALAVHFWSWLESLQLTTVAVSVTLVTTTPFFVAAAEWVRGRRPAWQSQASLVVALTGVAILASGSSGPTSAAADHRRGVALALLGAMAMAVYLVAGSQLRRTLASSASTAPTFLIAGVGLFGASLATGADVFDLGVRDWLIIAAMVLGPQLGGHAVLNHLLGRIGTMTVSLALLAEPVASAALAWVLLSEQPTGAALIGAAVVLIGLALRVIDPQASRSRRTANTS